MNLRILGHWNNEHRTFRRVVGLLASNPLSNGNNTQAKATIQVVLTGTAFGETFQKPPAGSVRADHLQALGYSVGRNE
jgi:hypothetical protein